VAVDGIGPPGPAHVPAVARLSCDHARQALELGRAKAALITGITVKMVLPGGLAVVGSYEVVGMVRRSSTLNFERIAHIQTG